MSGTATGMTPPYPDDQHNDAAAIPVYIVGGSAGGFENNGTEVLDVKSINSDGGAFTSDGNGNVTVTSISTAHQGTITVPSIQTNSGATGTMYFNFPANGLYSATINTGGIGTNGGICAQSFLSVLFYSNGTNSIVLNSSQGSQPQTYGASGEANWSIAKPGYTTSGGQNSFYYNVSCTDSNGSPSGGTYTWLSFVSYLKIG